MRSFVFPTKTVFTTPSNLYFNSDNYVSKNYALDFNSPEFNLPGGIYFYTLNAGEFKETRKMVLVK